MNSGSRLRRSNPISNEFFRSYRRAHALKPSFGPKTLVCSRCIGDKFSRAPSASTEIYNLKNPLDLLIVRKVSADDLTPWCESLRLWNAFAVLASTHRMRLPLRLTSRGPASGDINLSESKNTAPLWHRCREPTTSVGIGVGLSCTLTGFLRYSRTSSRRVLSRTHQPANSLARWTPRSAGCDHDSGNQEGGSVVLLGSTEGGPPIIEPQPHKISPQKYNRRESGGHPHCTLRKCFC